MSRRLVTATVDGSLCDAAGPKGEKLFGPARSRMSSPGGVHGTYQCGGEPRYELRVAARLGMEYG